MSYLVLPGGIPNFSKAVISLWFRVPQASIDAIADEAAAFEEASRPRLLGIVPLLVFGEMFEGYSTESRIAGQEGYVKSLYSFDGLSGDYTHIGNETHEYVIGPDLVATTTRLENPSYIGVFCNKDSDTGIITASLQVRLQAKEIGSGQWVAAMPRLTISSHSQLLLATNTGFGEPAQDTAYAYFLGTCLTGGVVPDGTKFETQSYFDQTEVWAGQQGPDAIVAGDPFNSPITIEPDKWHHLLLSFDVSQSTAATGGTVFDVYPCGPDPDRTLNLISAIASPCKMWIALDDQNYTDEYLADPRASPDRESIGLGANDVASYNNLYTTFVVNGGTTSRTWEVSGLVADRNWPVAGMPIYTYAGEDLPVQGHEFGIPGTTSLVDRIRRVEMAELQMWTDVTLDTGNVLNRRAFVDADGLPVDPTKGTDDDPRAPAERLLGKKPEILLHGNEHWQKGYNTGTLGIEIDVAGNVTKKPSGQFQPISGIEKYKPEPALGD
jgi:hypothetical protein